MKNILVFGFYGLVESEDFSYVFGENASRQEYQSLRVKTYNGNWPKLRKSREFLQLSEKELEHLHLQFFKSASRFTVYDGYDLCTVDNKFYQLLYYAQDLLIDSDPEILIFNDVPHATLEVMMYELAKLRGIRTVICMQNLFPACFFALDSIGSSEVYLKSNGGYGLSNEYLEYSSKPLDLPYMKDIKPPAENVFSMVLLNLTKLFHIRSVQRAKHKRSMSALISDLALYRKWKIAKRKRKLIKGELPNKFVYVPLHYQPEATTQSIGAAYYNQAFMVRELRALLTEDIEIVVKENPQQAIYGRGLDFYEMLDQLDGVQMVKDNTPSLFLCKKSLATATITGTAGWEALRMKKPVIYFGLPWYSKVYGAFSVSTDVVEKILAFEPDHLKFKDSMEQLSHCMFEGFIADGFWNNRPDMTYKENLELLKNSMNYLIQHADKGSQ